MRQRRCWHLASAPAQRHSREGVLSRDSANCLTVCHHLTLGCSAKRNWPMGLAVLRTHSSLLIAGESSVTVKLTGRPGSCWTATAPATAFPSLKGAHSADAAIVGAGIVRLP